MSASTLLLCGCAKVQIEHQADNFNRAISQSALEQLLLNVVRSSKDEPPSFTKLVKYTSENMLKGSLAPKLPFGPDAMSLFDLSPTVNLSTGANTIEYGDVNTLEGLKQLEATADWSTFHNASLPIRIRATLFIEGIEIHARLHEALMRHLKVACGKGAADVRCNLVLAADKACGTIWRTGRPLRFTGGEYYTYLNSATNECSFRAFQGLLAILSLSGFSTDAKVQEYPVTDGKEKVIGKRSIAIVNFMERGARSAFKSVEQEFKKAKIEDEVPLSIKLRSPKGMIEYLGQIVALENYVPEPYAPEFQLSEQDTVAFFVVHRGEPAVGEEVALSVQDRHGDQFFVPTPDYGNVRRHQTLRVLSVVSDLVNAAISAKGLPLATSVIVRGVD